MDKKQDSKPFGLRLMPDLRDWLRARVEENRRSLNREIEHRLLKSRETEGQRHAA